MVGRVGQFFTEVVSKQHPLPSWRIITSSPRLGRGAPLKKMSHFTAVAIPRPLDWQDFERKCAILFECIWGDTSTALNGRQGQPQHGVDIFGRPDGGKGGLVGVQCKGREGRYGKPVRGAELRSEVDKAKKFHPKIHAFTLVTTAPNDATIQRVANEITEEHRKSGSFPVAVWGWEELQRRVAEHPRALLTFHPDASPFTDEVRAELRAIRVEQRDSTEELAKKVDLLLQRTDTTGRGQIGQSTLDQSSEVAEAVDKALHRQIDQYRDLLKRGQARTALKLLTGLRDQLWSDKRISTRIRFRLLTNIGACQLHLRDEAAAADFFLQAYDFDKNDKVALANRALAYLLKGDWTSSAVAAREAMERHPDDPIPAAYLVNASVLDPHVTDPGQLLSEKLFESPHVCLATAVFWRRRGRVDEWRKWAIKALKADSEHEEVRIEAAEALLSPAFENRATAIGGRWPEGLRTDVQQSIELLEGIWAAAKASETPDARIASASNLANAYRHLNDIASARRVTDEALRVSPSDSGLLKISGALRFQERDFEGSVRDLERAEQTGDVVLMRAYALRLSARAQDALVLLSDDELGRLDPEFRRPARILRVEIAAEAVSADDALGEARQLLADNPENIEYHILLADLLVDHSNRDEAISTIESAVRLITKDTSLHERYLLAGLLRGIDRPEEAAGLLTGHIDETHNAEPLRLLITCLLESDQRQRVRQILDGLSDVVLTLPFYLRAKASLLSRTGRLSEARAVLDEYLRICSDDLNIRLSWLALQMQLGEDNAVRKFLSGTLSFPNARADDRIQLAHILDYYGYGSTALSYAYETFRKGLGDARVHLGYFGLLMLGRSAPSQIPTVSEINVDAVFTVEDTHNGRFSFIVLDEPNVDASRGEIRIDQPLARRALGRKVGDTLEVAEGRSPPDQRVIVEVKHKYLHALHLVMQQFESMFPDNAGLESVRLGEGSEGLQPVLKKVRDYRDSLQALEQCYEREVVPIGLVADAFRTNPIKCWQGLVHSGRRIDVCVGTEIERRAAFDLIYKNARHGCVVDPITLSVIRALKVSEAVVAVCGRIGVTHSTIGVLQALREETATHRGRPFMVLSMEGEQYVRREVSPEEVDAAVKSLDDDISWVTSTCDLLPAEASSDPEAEWRAIGRMMHASFMDTVLAASGSGRILISEDRRYRLLAHQAASINSVWLQPVLMIAANSGRMPHEAYSRVTAHLIGANHFFTSVGARVLFDLAKETDSSASPEFRRVVNTLGGSTTDIASSIAVAAGFCVDIWRADVSPQTARLLTNLVMESLMRERWKDWRAIIESFLDQVRMQSSGKAMWVYTDVKRTIEAWCRGHFLFAN